MLIDLGPVLVARWWAVDPAWVDAMREVAVAKLGVAALDGPDALYAPVGPDALRITMDLVAALAGSGPHGHPGFTVGLAAGPVRLRGEGAARVLDGPAVWRASRLSTLAAVGEVWASAEVVATVPEGLGVFRAPAGAEARFGERVFLVRDYR